MPRCAILLAEQGRAAAAAQPPAAQRHEQHTAGQGATHCHSARSTPTTTARAAHSLPQRAQRDGGVGAQLAQESHVRQVLLGAGVLHARDHLPNLRRAPTRKGARRSAAEDVGGGQEGDAKPSCGTSAQTSNISAQQEACRRVHWLQTCACWPAMWLKLSAPLRCAATTACNGGMRSFGGRSEGGKLVHKSGSAAHPGLTNPVRSTRDGACTQANNNAGAGERRQHTRCQRVG